MRATMTTVNLVYIYWYKILILPCTKTGFMGKPTIETALEGIILKYFVSYILNTLGKYSNIRKKCGTIRKGITGGTGPALNTFHGLTSTQDLVLFLTFSNAIIPSRGKRPNLQN